MSLIQSNTSIEISFVNNNERFQFTCNVVSVNEDYVLLACPKEHRSNLIALEPKMEIMILVSQLSGVRVMTSAVKSVKNNEFITIDVPAEKETIQRREFFRVNLQRPIEISYSDQYESFLFKGKIIDLSGGGVRFWTNEKVRVGFMAKVVMHIQDMSESTEPVEASGRILYTRAHESKFTTKPGYISVIKFQDISAYSRKLIMRACFNLQISMKMKGVL